MNIYTNSSFALLLLLHVSMHLIIRLYLPLISPCMYYKLHQLPCNYYIIS